MHIVYYNLIVGMQIPARGLIHPRLISYLPVENMTDPLIESGIVAYQQGNTRQAMAVFSNLIKKNESNADAWFWMGRCMEDPEKARFCFERAASLNDNLISREYIYVDPDDIPRANNIQSTYDTLMEPQPITQMAQERPVEILQPILVNKAATSDEINPFLALPLPDGFVYHRTGGNRLEVVLIVLLVMLVGVLLLAIIMNYL